MVQRPALFLDRDGVINIDHGYVHRPEDFEFMPGIFELVRFANERDYRVVVVTNQAGIGRGYYSEEQFHKLTDWMCERFTEQGCKIDKVYFCPFHPEHGIGVYKKDSEYRKPNPGMLLMAATDLNLLLNESILVGDKLSDIDAAVSAGIQKIFLFGSVERCCSAISIFELSEVVDFIERESIDES
jgi:D-glycero-D-manno-heptose 1,7-bisphosphate phosphatase